MKVSRGRIVECYGPWSNGHSEQTAIVTNVYGEGDEVGVPVNLHVFVDLDQTMVCHQVPFYPSRQLAIAAMVANDTRPNGGAIVCYWPERA